MKRTTRRTVIYSVLAGAVLLFIIVLWANAAHRNFDVWLDGVFLAVPLIVWNAIGIVGFVVFLVLEILMIFFSDRLFQVRGLAPDHTGTHLNVRCRSCGVVHWIEDTGERPISHFCPHCGSQGEWGGPGRGDKDFIYTQVEVKIGCTNCHTTFVIPEPLVRPLWAQCPTCEKVGVLKEGELPVEAEEVEIACSECSHAYHVYAPRGQWDHRFLCPSCGHENRAQEPENYGEPDAAAASAA